MSVTKPEVINTAKLANLAISEDMIPELQDSMNKIVAMFDQLSAVNTDQVKHLDILQKIELETLNNNNPARDEDNADILHKFAIDFDNSTGEYLAPKVIDEE